MNEKPTYTELEQRIKELENAEYERKRKEDALRESEERHRTILSTAMDGFLIVDSTGRLMEVNETYCRMSGYTERELLGAGLDLLEDAETAAETAAHLQKVMALGQDRFESRHRRKDGSVFDVEVSVQYRPAYGRNLVAFIRDITGLKRMEEEHRKSERKYRQLFEYSPISLWEEDFSEVKKRLDQLGNETSGDLKEYLIARPDLVNELSGLVKVIDINEATLRLYNASSKSEFLSEFTRIFSRESYEGFVSALTTIIEGGTELFLENTHLTLSGEIVHVQLHWAVAPGHEDHYDRVSVCIVDITERKRAEEALLDSEQKYRTLVVNAREAIFVAHEGKVIFVNPMTSLMTGYSAEEIQASPFIEFIHQEDRGMVLERHVRRLKGEEPPHTYSFRIIRKDGSLMWGELNTVLINWNGKPATLNFLSDITNRRRAEKMLREREAQFRVLFYDSPVSMILHDKDNGDVIDANESAYKAYGLSSVEELKSVQFWADPPYSFDEALAWIRKAAKDGPQEFEWMNIKANGELFWEQVRLRLVKLNEVERVLATSIHITERKLAEKALRKSEEQYRSILEVIPDIIIQSNREGDYIDIHTASENMLARPRKELLGKNIAEVLQREDAARLIESIGTALDKRCLQSLEYALRVPDGQRFFEARVVPLGEERVIACIRDITQRKLAERENRLNKNRLEIIYKIATMTDATEEEICDVVLQAMLDLTGSPIGFLGFLSDDESVMRTHAWSSPATAGCAVHDKPLEFPVDRAGLWGESVRNRRAMICNEYAAPHPAKKGFPEGHVEVRRFMTVPVFDGVRIVGVAGVGNREEPYDDLDVRQIALLMEGWWWQVRRRRMEREKEALQARLNQAQKMEAIGTLAGGIAHDFNNILSIIVGNTELAMLDLPEWRTAQSNLKEVRKATLRARDLVRQILLFAREKEHTPSHIGLEPIAKESLKMLRASIPATVEISAEISSGLPPVLADPSQIQQIIMNLCTNAGQVMEAEGGTLTFTLDAADLKAPLHTVMGELPPGRYVRMKVGDTGLGIPAENLTRIFDPFFTTKGVGEGTGLGLAVVHGIVQDRKGGITVESEKGRGTTFVVYLPASEAEPVEAAAKAEKELPVGTERVLFVDDEPMVVKLGRHMLERRGYTVETRASGTDALECFRQDPGRFDLVVTDMTMPGMRGDRLAEEILAIRPDIPVILCTGYSRQISREKALQIGIRAFVMKPLTQHELVRTVREVLDAA
jgi:PAS domain S-box-containing protein